MLRVIAFFKNILLLHRFDAARFKIWRAWKHKLDNDDAASEMLWDVLVEMQERRKHLFEPKLGTCLSANGARSTEEHYETNECEAWQESTTPWHGGAL